MLFLLKKPPPGCVRKNNEQNGLLAAAERQQQQRQQQRTWTEEQQQRRRRRRRLRLGEGGNSKKRPSGVGVRRTLDLAEKKHTAKKTFLIIIVKLSIPEQAKKARSKI